MFKTEDIMRIPGNTFGRVLTTLCFISLTMLPGMAATLVVCPGCPDPGKYPSLSPAVSAASNGDTILIEPGFYPGGINLNKDLSLIPLGNGVVVDGGGVGSVFEISSTATVYIGSLTVTNGAIDAGIMNYGDLELQGTIISGNTGIYGGIGNLGGDLYMEGATVFSNSGPVSYGFGGGLNNFAGTVYLYHVTLEENHGYTGGGVYNSVGTITFDHAIIIKNTSTSSGGGFANIDIGGTVDIIRWTGYYNASDTTSCNKYFDVNRTPICK